MLPLLLPGQMVHDDDGGKGGDRRHGTGQSLLARVFYGWFKRQMVRAPTNIFFFDSLRKVRRWATRLAVESMRSASKSKGLSNSQPVNYRHRPRAAS